MEFRHWVVNIPVRSKRIYGSVLGFLAFAFFLRVMGQALVAFFKVNWLPPMTEWYSDLIPYHVLFPIQLVILALQAKVSWDIWKDGGFFANHRPRFGKWLCWFSYVYFIGMVLRYVITMSLYPERRWFTGIIPIFFHWILAA